MDRLTPSQRIVPFLGPASTPPRVLLQDAYMPGPTSLPAGPDLRALLAARQPAPPPATARLDTDAETLKKVSDADYELFERDAAGDRKDLTPADLAARLHDPSRTTTLFMSRYGDEIEIPDLAALAPLRFFFADSPAAPDSTAAALKALQGERCNFRSHGDEKDAFQAWRILRDPAQRIDVSRHYEQGKVSVDGGESLLVLAHVWAGAPTTGIARPQRAESLRRLEQEGRKIEGSLLDAYLGNGPVRVKDDDVTLLEVPAAALDHPADLAKAAKERAELYGEIKSAVHYNQAEQVWARLQEDVPGVPFEQRAAAVVALGKSSRYNDDAGDLYDTLLAHRPQDLSFPDAATDLAAYVSQLGGKRGSEAWRIANERIVPGRPAGLPATAARQAFHGLIQAADSGERAERLWGTLVAADVPDALPARLAAVKSLNEDVKLSGDDLVAAVDTLMELRRADESLAAEARDLKGLADLGKGDAAVAFRFLRRDVPTLGPSDVPATDKAARFQALLAVSKTLSDAQEQYRAVAEAQDAASFTQRADAMEQIVRLSQDRRWRGQEALDTFRTMERRVPGVGFAAPDTAQVLRLLDETRSPQLAELIHAALLRTAGEDGYPAAESCFQAIVAAAPEGEGRAERALSDYHFLLRRSGVPRLDAAAARFCSALQAAGDADEARRAMSDLETLQDPSQYLRLLTAGGRASTARDAVALLRGCAPQDEALVTRLLQTLRKPRSPEDGPHEALLLAEAALTVPGAGPLADVLAAAAEASEKRCDVDEPCLEPLRREVLAPSRDRADAADRLRDYAALLEASRKLEDAQAAWRATDSPNPAQRHARTQALIALLTPVHEADRAVAMLHALESRLQPGEDLVEHAKIMGHLAERSSRADLTYARLRDWAVETRAAAGLWRYADVCATRGEDDLMTLMAMLTVPVGNEDFAARERLFWSLDDGKDGVRHAFEDYQHLTRSLHPRTSLEEAGRAWKTLLVACMDRREQAANAFDRLHARLWDHPDETIEGLAAWLAMNMTVNGDPDRVIARLDAIKGGAGKVEQTPDEVVIGRLRIPVRKGSTGTRAWSEALDDYLAMTGARARPRWQLAPPPEAPPRPPR